ncbi:MAG: glycerate kinase, partial [Neisseriaceae bacterium]
NGKVISGIANYSKHKNTPLIVLCGTVNDKDIDLLYESGVTTIFPIVRGISNLPDAIDQAKDNLRYTANNVVRLIL